MRTLILFCLLCSPCLAHRTAQEAAEASAAGGLRHRGGHAPFAEGLGVRVHQSKHSDVAATQITQVTRQLMLVLLKAGMVCG